MKATRRALCISLALASLAVTMAAGIAPAAAQDYPTRPIRIVVPYPAGGNADSAARALAEAVSPSLKQVIIIDNRPGASTINGTDMEARGRAPPIDAKRRTHFSCRQTTLTSFYRWQLQRIFDRCWNLATILSTSFRAISGSFGDAPCNGRNRLNSRNLGD